MARALHAERSVVSATRARADTCASRQVGRPRNEAGNRPDDPAGKEGLGEAALHKVRSRLRWTRIPWEPGLPAFVNLPLLRGFL